jgi:hypothetical protein
MDITKWACNHLREPKTRSLASIKCSKLGRRSKGVYCHAHRLLALRVRRQEVQSSERSGEWVPIKPKLVVELRYDHVTDNRFRHGTKLVRFRPDKAPRQCTFEQIRPATTL